MNIKNKVLNVIAKLEDDLKLLIKCYKGLKIALLIIQDIIPQIINTIESIWESIREILLSLI